MRNLTKAQEATKDDLTLRLNRAKTDVLSVYTEVVDVLSRLNTEITAYNEVVAELETFRDELVGDMETYYDDRSEKWQEGDAGSSYQDWKGEWEGLSVDEVPEVEAPDEPQMDHPDELENLSNEVSE